MARYRWVSLNLKNRRLHRNGELDLLTATSVLAGVEGGKALAPGDPEASLSWKMVAADEMPKNPIWRNRR